jgi:hypothetical protein
MFGQTLAKARFGMLLLPACLGISACSTTQVHSTVDDNEAPMISTTFIIRPESWRPVSERKGWGGVEVGYEHQAGDASQNIKNNEFIAYDLENQFKAPQAVHHDASVDHAHLAYNRLFSFGPNFQLEPSLGIAHDNIYIETKGVVTNVRSAESLGTLAIRYHQSVTGITAGVIPRWNFNRFLAVEVPLRIGVGFASREDSLSTFSSRNNGITEVINPTFVFRPVKNISLGIGYAARSQHVETSLDESNLDLDFQGFSAALRVTF